MNEEDARIDRVLQRLGEAEPTDGLEQRVLLAVRSRSAADEWRNRREWRWSRATMFATAGLAAALLLALWMGLPKQQAPPQTRPVPFSSARSEPVSPTRSPSQLAVDRRPAAEARQTSSLRRLRAADTTTVNRAQRRPAAARWHNHPAPEAPLTREEQALLRIAHRGRPEDYAALNLAVQEARASTERADVANFFDPPTRKEERQ